MIARAVALIGIVLAAFCICAAQERRSKPVAASEIPCLQQYYLDVLGILRPSVCDKQWIEGRYVCKDFARDACNEWRKGGTRAWKLTAKLDTGATTNLEFLRCAEMVCGLKFKKVPRSTSLADCKNGPIDSLSSLDQALLLDCARMFHGHALNVVDITDATSRRLHQYVFAAIEPQDGDPTTAALCTWKQETPDPVIPDRCKKEIVAKSYDEQRAGCGVKWQLGVHDCNVPLENGDSGGSSASSSSLKAE